MAVKIFQPAEDKEACKQALRDGATIEDCLNRFSVSRNTVYRYARQVKREQETGYVDREDVPDSDNGKQKASSPVIQTPATTGVSKDSFTPSGQRSAAPSGAPAPEFLTVGTFRMPLEDWGYSSSRNLFLVADTYDIAKKQYNFPDKMKVGDFLAELCQMLRLMCGWDVIGGGVYQVNIVKEGGSDGN